MKLAANFAFAITALFLATPSYAQCIPNPVPGNWLQTQEYPTRNPGGHTLDMHVGWTDDEMRDRVEFENVAAQGSYTDAVTAQAAITSNAVANAANAWFANAVPGDGLGRNFVAPGVIGRVAWIQNNGQPTVASTQNFRVVFVVDDNGACYLFSSYPRP